MSISRILIPPTLLSCSDCKLQYLIFSDRNDGAYKRNFASNILNAPLFIYEDLGINPSVSRRLPAPGSILDDMFFPSTSSEPLYGSIDVVDMKLVRHTILHTYNDFEVAMVLRNKFNGFLSLNKTAKHGGEGIFKNKYIDTLKSTPRSKNEFGCDENKQILKNQRYDIEVIL